MARVHSMRNMTVDDFQESLKCGPFSSVGSYPLFWLTSDGCTLSHKAVVEMSDDINDAIRTQTDNGWRVVAISTNFEDAELYCDHTGDRIESAYAEPEDDESE